MWLSASLKNLSYDGSMEWETFIHQFISVADQFGLDDRKKTDF